MTALVIAVLSFQHLGRPAECPPAANVKAPRSALQDRLMASVEGRVRAYVRLVAGITVDAGSGRKAGKAISELEKEGERALSQLYGGLPGMTRPGEGCKATSGPGPLQVKADRVALPQASCTFFPEQYLDGFARQAFLDPSRLDLAEPPRPPRAVSHVTSSEYRKLLARQDAAEMIELEPAVTLGDSAMAAGMFAVAKSAGADRLITNRKPRNSQERGLGVSGSLFPHGTCFCDLQLGPRDVVFGHGDDLPDFYHTCRCSAARARTNAVGPIVSFGEVAHLRAAARAVSRWGTLQDDEPMRAVQRSLPMGDKSATDFAELAHIGVLRTEGCGLLPELLSYRQPAPRGDVWEVVMVDDRVVVETAREGRRSARAAAMLGAGDRAYERAKLEPKAEKRFRDQSVFEAIGARVDGRRGWTSAKPAHILLATALTVELVRLGRCTGSLLATVVSLWVHILLFQRVGFVYMDHVFHEVSRRRSHQREARPLGGAPADELLTLAVLAPLWGTNLRAPVRDVLVCTDASGGKRPWAAGVGTRIPAGVARELWRHRVRRGGRIDQLA